jgi:hypothetical protein
MAVPYGMRFDIAFDDMFPQGAFLRATSNRSPSTSPKRTKPATARSAPGLTSRPASASTAPPSPTRPPRRNATSPSPSRSRPTFSPCHPRRSATCRSGPSCWKA